jgi:hypothetical protein
MAALDQVGQAMTRGLGRLPAVLVVAAVALAAVALAALAPGSPLALPCTAAGTHRAAVVVEHSSGSFVTRCVAFSTATVTGEELLNLSGVAWSGATFGGFGDAVCALDSEPVNYSTCPGKDNYWAVFVSRSAGPWQLANVGISSLTLGNGDAEGFRYVPATGTPAAPPSAAGVCPGAAAPTPFRSVGNSAQTQPPATATLPASVLSSSVSTTVGGTLAPAATTLVDAGAGNAATAGNSLPPRAPAPSDGADPGLLLAAGAGGGLAGLALLRLLIRRRAGP